MRGGRWRVVGRERPLSNQLGGLCAAYESPQVFAHKLRAIMMDSPVARQHPFELIREQLLQRSDLIAPREPCHRARRAQRPSFRRPPQMISAEEKLLLVKKDHMASSVSGSGNDQQIIAQSDISLTFYDSFYAEPRCAVGSVHDPLAAKPLREFVVVGYIVSMGQEHGTNSAHLFDTLDEGSREAR